jgi:hypothetical protein
MRRRIIAAAVVVLVVLACGGVGFATTQPPDYHDYRKTANQAAESAYGAVRTTALAVGALLEDRVTGPYTTVVVDDAVTAASSATQQLAAVAPPDDRTRAMRAELAPLLADAARELGDVSAALDGGQPDRIRTAAQGLGQLGDRLDDYLQEHA